MMSSKDGVGEIIKTLVTVVTFIALTRWFRVIKATLHNLLRLTRGTPNTIGPAQLTNRLITLHLVDELRDVHLHGRTPVRDRGIGCRQYTPSSHATTLESNKSVISYVHSPSSRSTASSKTSLNGVGRCQSKA